MRLLATWIAVIEWYEISIFFFKSENFISSKKVFNDDLYFKSRFSAKSASDLYNLRMMYFNYHQDFLQTTVIEYNVYSNVYLQE